MSGFGETNHITLKNYLMEKKNIIITIGGQAGSGKSHLAYLLKTYLRENGFEVEQKLNMDYSSERDFDINMNKNFDDAFNDIKKTRKITINEVQLARI